MKILRGMLTIVVAYFAVNAYAIKPGGETGSLEYKYIGISDAAVVGTDGLSAYTLACRDTYGDQARMATSKEIIDHGVFPSLSETIWVKPIITHAAFNGARIIFSDYSGAFDKEPLSCLAHVNDGLGFSLSIQRFAPWTCSNTFRLACSAPQ